MITGYRIQNENDGAVLFLYMDSVEFSWSWLQELRDFSIKRFISEHKLNFNGNKVVLVLGSGIMITLLLTGANYNNGTNNNNIDNISYIPNTLNILNDKLLPASDGIDQSNDSLPGQITNDSFKDNATLSNETANNDNGTVSSQGNKNTGSGSGSTSKPSSSNNSSFTNTNSNASTNVNASSNVNVNSSGNSNTTTSQNKPTNSTNISTNTTTPSNDGSTTSGNISNNTSSSNSSVQSEMQVTVRRSNGQTVTLGMTDYLVGVVASEMPASFNVEALKAQAVLARTYALKRIKNNLVLTDTTSTQVYKDNNQLRALWGNNYDKYYSKIRNAVIQTDKEVCLYNGTLIDAVYHSTSNGMTEDAVNVWGNSTPYLVSVESPTDTSASSYLKTSYFDNTKLLELFGIDISSLKIEVLTRNQSGRVDRVSVNGQVYSGVQFRNLFGLRSSDFDISYSGGGLSITTRGFGHGVGMSQYGANGMAGQGANYREILTHYYKNITIEKR